MPTSILKSSDYILSLAFDSFTPLVSLVSSSLLLYSSKSVERKSLKVVIKSFIKSSDNVGHLDLTSENELLLLSTIL